MSARSGNRTSAPVQALDHKSDSLPRGHCVWLIKTFTRDYLEFQFQIPHNPKTIWLPNFQIRYDLYNGILINDTADFDSNTRPKREEGGGWFGMENYKRLFEGSVSKTEIFDMHSAFGIRTATGSFYRNQSLLNCFCSVRGMDEN